MHPAHDGLEDCDGKTLVPPDDFREENAIDIPPLLHGERFAVVQVQRRRADRSPPHRSSVPRSCASERMYVPAPQATRSFRTG